MTTPPHPGRWRGGYLDVATLTDSQRSTMGLSCLDTIIEIVGTPENEFGFAAVLEAVTYAESRAIATLDLETDGDDEWADDDDKAGLDPHKAQIVLCQIGDEDRQYLIWWNTISPDAKELVRRWWVSPEHRKAGVNLKFDCYDDATTEFLTGTGWRRFDDVTPDDVLATVNLATQELEYQRPTGRVDNLYSGRMYRAGGAATQGRVTAKHNMVVRYEGDREWSLAPAQDVVGGGRGPRSVNSRKEFMRTARVTRPDANVSDAYLQLAGLYISEGSPQYNYVAGVGRGKGQKGGERPAKSERRLVCCRIVQTSRGRSAVFPLMDTLGVEFPITRGDYTYSKLAPNAESPRDVAETVWRVKGDTARRLVEDFGAGSYTKTLPDWVFSLSRRQVMVLFDAMMLGDGCAALYSNTRVYNTRSADLASRLSALLVSAGFLATQYQYGADIRVNLSVLPEESFTSFPAQSWEEYEVVGTRVVCFEVPNGTLITRNEGQPAIHGNCKMLLAQEGLDWRGDRLADAQIFEQILGCGLIGLDIGHTMKMTGMGAMAKRWLGWLMPKDEDIRTGWGKMTPGKWHMTEQEHTDAVAVGMALPTFAEVCAKGDAKRYYAADDCIVPVRLVNLQAPWLVEFGLIPTVKLEMDFLPVLSEMEVRGLPLDWAQWETLAQETEVALAKAERDLDALFEVTVTYRVDLAEKVEITRDKNYGSKDELKDLIRVWMLKEYGIEVIGNNKQFKDACVAAGMNPIRAAKVFQQKLVPNPEDSQKNKQVGYPNMVDYIIGSEFVDSRWEEFKGLLPDQSFALPTTDSKFLKLLRILNETPNEQIDQIEEIPTNFGLPPTLVGPILAHRESTTRMQRYAYSWKALINPVSNRVHTTATQTAADTARVQTRPNFQNLPADQRYREAACRAPKGYKIVGADFSQIEPRIIGEISLCPMYMRVFWSDRPGTEGFDYWCGEDVTEPLDLYGAVGATLGVLPPEAEKKSIAKKKEPEIVKGRKKSKIAVLGLGYGTGKPKFHISYCLDTGEYHPRAESDLLFDSFWEAASEVKETLDMLSDLAYPGAGTRSQKASPRFVYHPFTEERVTWSESLGGRKRYFDHKSPQWWTQGRNHPIQATGADILKRTCVVLAQWMWAEEIDGFLILTAHDELIAEIIENRAEEVKLKMEEIMSLVGEEYCPHVPVTAEGYVADFWVKD